MDYDEDNQKINWKQMGKSLGVWIAIAIAIVIGIGMLTGCASMFSDSHYPVEIKSDPSHSRFTVTDTNGNLVHEGVTPQTIILRAASYPYAPAHYKIKTWKDGYAPAYSALSAEVDTLYYWNALNILGFFMSDPGSGAMFRLPESTHVFLSEAPPSVTLPVCYYNCIPWSGEAEIHALSGTKTITTKVIPLGEKTTVEKRREVRTTEETVSGCNKEEQPCGKL